MLHTAIVHGGVSNFAQSTPQGPCSPPPVLLLLPLLVLVLVLGASPEAQEHPAFHTTRSKNQTQIKFLM